MQLHGAAQRRHQAAGGVSDWSPDAKAQLVDSIFAPFHAEHVIHAELLIPSHVGLIPNQIW